MSTRFVPMMGWLWALVLMVSWEYAPAQSMTTRASEIAGFFAAAQSRRVDIVCLGDSNQLLLGGGWDDAWTNAIGGEFGIYASGLHPLGENSGFGAGIGRGTTTSNSAGAQGVSYSNAPFPTSSFFTSGQGRIPPLDAVWIAKGESVPASLGLGMLVAPSWLGGANSPLRFHFAYSLFSGGEAGQFSPTLRSEVSPFPTLVSGGTYSTLSSGTGSTWGAGFLDLPEGVRAGNVSLRLGGTTGISGPFAGLFARVENRSRLHGASVHVLFAAGGKGARDMALSLQNASDSAIDFYLEQVTALQSGDPQLLVRISTGVNDRRALAPSLGPEAFGCGACAEAYADNLRAIINRLRSRWVAMGRDPAGLYFLLTPSVPTGEPDDPLLVAYRDHASNLAREESNTAAVNLPNVVAYKVLLINRWYLTEGDENHLRLDGLRAVARAELFALIRDGKSP